VLILDDERLGSLLWRRCPNAYPLGMVESFLLADKLLSLIPFWQAFLYIISLFLRLLLVL
jgi:hypothetical protein